MKNMENLVAQMKVISIVAKIAKKSPDEILIYDDFFEDLNLQAKDVMKIRQEVEKVFKVNIPGDLSMGFNTVSELGLFIYKNAVSSKVSMG
jgi:acyl carrier protein